MGRRIPATADFLSVSPVAEAQFNHSGDIQGFLDNKILNGAFINTEYIAENFYYQTKQFIATATRSGVWSYKTNKLSQAMAGFVVNPVPLQFTSGDTYYNDAKVGILVHLISNFMAPQASSSIKWKLSELLLKE